MRSSSLYDRLPTISKWLKADRLLAVGIFLLVIVATAAAAGQFSAGNVVAIVAYFVLVAAVASAYLDYVRSRRQADGFKAK